MKCGVNVIRCQHNVMTIRVFKCECMHAVHAYMDRYVAVCTYACAFMCMSTNVYVGAHVAATCRCLCVCVCLRRWKYMYMLTHMFFGLCMRICICICMCKCRCKCICTCTYVNVHVDVYVYVSVYVYDYVYEHVSGNLWVYVHVSAYVHLYTCTYIHLWPFGGPTEVLLCFCAEWSRTLHSLRERIRSLQQVP